MLGTKITRQGLDSTKITRKKGWTDGELNGWHENKSPKDGESNVMDENNSPKGWTVQK